ncbi:MULTISPECIES: VOC family protein [Corallincola]|uniref:VOC family protein n=1 Tax=Corallincola TaxID=1775176 RepID=UPI001F185C3E|nr:MULTISPECIES: VOC family protein [Corallincola]
MIKLEHIAIWTRDLEGLKTFYVDYFEATASQKYTNEAKGFSSYFLAFDGEARIELMQNKSIPDCTNDPYQQATGLTHMAISVGSEYAVDNLTERLKADGYEVLDGPRRTGDGYYESVVLDPENNRIEITA